MKIKVLFDDEVVLDTVVKSAELSESRDVVAIYDSKIYKEEKKRLISEMVPSAKGRFCIEYEVIDEEMPNSYYYLMSCDSLPKKIKNVTTTCPECSKDVKVKISV